MHCNKCSKKGTIDFRILSIRTLKIRDLDKEKRVQAIGDFSDHAICNECAEEKLNSLLHPAKLLLPKIFLYAIILLAGLLLLSVFISRDHVLAIFAASAILCGSLGIIYTIKENLQKANMYKSMEPQTAKEKAAWELLLETLPKKEGDNDLNYIPINTESLNLKNGNLMILYDLLPAIAKEAHELIHKEN